MTGGQEKKIRLFDLENRNTEPLTLTGHEGTIKRCLFIDQNTIMTIGDDKTFRQWDLRLVLNPNLKNFNKTSN